MLGRQQCGKSQRRVLRKARTPRGKSSAPCPTKRACEFGTPERSEEGAAAVKVEKIIKADKILFSCITSIVVKRKLMSMELCASVVLSDGQ